MQEPGLTDIIPFICISALWASMLHFFTSELLCSPQGVAAAMAARSLQIPGCPQGSEIHIWRDEITDDPDILFYWYGRKYSIFSIPYPKDSIYNHKLEFSSPVILCKTFPHLSFQIQNTQELGSYFTYALINFPEVSRPGLPYTVAISHMWLYLNSLKLNIIQSPVAQSHWSHFKCPTNTCGSDSDCTVCGNIAIGQGSTIRHATQDYIWFLWNHIFRHLNAFWNVKWLLCRVKT